MIVGFLRERYGLFQIYDVTALNLRLNIYISKKDLQIWLPVNTVHMRKGF